MKLTDVSNDLADKRDFEIVRKMERLLAISPKYKNIDSKNKELILDLIRKYKKLLDRGIKPSRLTIKRDRYKLYHERVKLGLSETDLKQIFDLLESFKN